MRALVVVATVIVSAGCATTSPEARREAEARRTRCAAIEIVPAGVSPSRPYQVLAPITADASAHGGQEALRDDACRMGADAVINVRKEAPPDLTPSGPAAIFEERAQLIGTAVLWTDVAVPTDASEP